MRVLFIYPVPPETKKVYTGYYHGIGSLSAMLKKNGHETRLFIVNAFQPDLITQTIDAFAPGLVAISTTSLQAGLTNKISGYIAQRHRLPIIVGGIHPTIAPDDALACDGILGIVRGEGEYALTELVDALQRREDFSAIQNCWFKRDGQVIRNDVRPLADLDQLPYVDREIYDYQALLDRNRSTVGAEFMAGRGCPYECAYCSNHKVRELYGSRDHRAFVRTRKVDNVIGEIKAVLTRYENIRILGFHDDIFPLQQNWLEEFAEIYTREIGIPFWCNSRVDLLDEQVLSLLKNAGCVRVHMGVESGSERIKTDILRKNITNQQVVDAFALVKKFKMKTVAFNMIGLPDEGAGEIEETIALNRCIKPDWIVVSLFYPFPGTILYDKCLSMNILCDIDSESYYDQKSCLKSGKLSREKLIERYNNFVQDVYK